MNKGEYVMLHSRLSVELCLGRSRGGSDAMQEIRDSGA